MAVTLVVASGTLALAHERREVGPYTFVVGWLVEPAYTRHLNGVDLRVAETATGTPVEGLQETLRVTVTAAGQSRTFALRARFGQAGAYAADLIPTQVATYVFRFQGSIGDLQVDESFESGPGRFDEPQPAAEAEFPSASHEAGATAVAEQARLLAAAALLLAIALPLGLHFWRHRARE